LTHTPRNTGALHNPNSIFIAIKRDAKPHNLFPQRKADFHHFTLPLFNA
jgi:hypothetical protein